MAFSTVTLEVADKAKAGSTVNARITIRNNYTAPIYFAAVGVVGTTDRFIDWRKAWIPAGGALYFDGSFTMPNTSVTVNAYSYYRDTEGAWRSDASTSKRVGVEAAGVVLLASASRVVDILIEAPPPTAEVYLLDSRTVDVGVLQELFLLARAERVVMPDAVGVILLARAERVVLAGDVTGIVLLDKAEQQVIPVGVPVPTPEEVENNKMLWAALAVVGVVIVGTIVASRG